MKDNKLYYWQKFLIWIIITGILSLVAFSLRKHDNLSLLLITASIVLGITAAFYLVMTLIKIILILKNKLTQRKRIKMGKQKGFLRLTLVLSILSAIIVFIWGSIYPPYCYRLNKVLYLTFIWFIAIWMVYIIARWIIPPIVKWIIVGFKEK